MTKKTTHRRKEIESGEHRAGEGQRGRERMGERVRANKINCQNLTEAQNTVRDSNPSHASSHFCVRSQWRVECAPIVVQMYTRRRHSITEPVFLVGNSVACGV